MAGSRNGQEGEPSGGVELEEEEKEEGGSAIGGQGEDNPAAEETHGAGGQGPGGATPGPGRALGGDRSAGDEEEDQSIPGLGGAPGGESSVGVVLKLQSRIARVLHEHHGKELISHLKARATDTKGKRTLVRFQGARSKGAMAWVACQGIHRGERTTPDLYRGTLGRCLGSHDEDVPVGGRCYAGCPQPMTKNHSLCCVQGGLQNHTHETILRGFLVKALHRCNIIHAVESTLPFKGRTTGDQGSLKMDVVTNPGSLFGDNPKF